MITPYDFTPRPVLDGYGDQPSDNRGDPIPAAPLTQAELRVLALVRQGLSNKEISRALGRAEPTIKHQISACLKKYQVPSRSRLIAVALGAV